MVFVAVALAASLPAEDRSGRPASGAGASDASIEGASAQRAVPQVYHRALTERGIEPTAKGIRLYLASWAPAAPDPNRIAKLIEQLGDDRYRTREQATRALISIWPAPEAAIQKALTSADPEIRIRAAKVRAEGLAKSVGLALALRVAEYARLEGIVPTLLQIVPHCPDDSSRLQICSTIHALAQPGDAKVLAKALGDESDHVKLAAAVGLLQFDRQRVRTGLAAVGEKAPDALRLAAARLMCFAGRRESLATLCEFLRSPDAQLRADAALALYDVTGKPMPFLAFDPNASAGQAGRWAQWLKQTPPRLPPAPQTPAPYWPRNVALHKAVTSAVPESDQYCVTLGFVASCLTDGQLVNPPAAPGSVRIDYTIDLRRTTDGLDLAALLPRGYRIHRIVVHWRHFGGTRPNKQGGLFHYAQKYDVMAQPVGSTQWLPVRRCNTPPEKEPEDLTGSPLILKYVSDNRQTMLAGLDLRRIARLRLIASGPHWLGAYELQAFGLPETDPNTPPQGKTP